MDSLGDDPNVAFLKPAQSFLDIQPILAQAELISIATWLFGDPAVDGDTKDYMIVGWLGGVRQYRRVYHDDQYSIVYSFDEHSDPPLLTVEDIFLTP